MILRQLIFAPILLWTAPVLGEEGHEDHHGHHEEVPASHQKLLDELSGGISRERAQVASFQKYEGQIRLLCGAIEKDGRRRQIYELASEAVLKEGVTCPECKSLLKAFASGCREVKKREMKKKTPIPGPDEAGPETEDGAATPVPPTPTPLPSRMPSTEALDLASRLAVAISSDNSKGLESQVSNAINTWASVLRRSKEKSIGFSDYCGILATYLTAPWERAARSAEFRNKLHPKDKEDSESVDTLFEE